MSESVASPPNRAFTGPTDANILPLKRVSDSRTSSSQPGIAPFRTSGSFSARQTVSCGSGMRNSPFMSMIGTREEMARQLRRKRPVWQGRAPKHRTIGPREEKRRDFQNRKWHRHLKSGILLSTIAHSPKNICRNTLKIWLFPDRVWPPPLTIGEIHETDTFNGKRRTFGVTCRSTGRTRGERFRPSGRRIGEDDPVAGHHGRAEIRQWQGDLREIRDP